MNYVVCVISIDSVVWPVSVYKVVWGNPLDFVICGVSMRWMAMVWVFQWTG